MIDRFYVVTNGFQESIQVFSMEIIFRSKEVLKKVNLLQSKMSMETKSMRQKLHQFIDMIEDKKAEAIYTLLEDEIDTSFQRRKLILADREDYLSGESKSYSWQDVKEMALNKEKRNGV